MRGNRPRRLCGLLAAAMLILSGCTGRQTEEKLTEQAQETLQKSYQTTAKVTYQDLEAVMVIYKEPANCAQVTFESPESLRDMKMTFYTDRVKLSYQELEFDFVPDSLPGNAAAQLILTALNNALKDEGVSVKQEGEALVVSGSTDEGEFYLLIDRENGNILRLSIPEKELTMEVLNFKFLEG